MTHLLKEDFREKHSESSSEYLDYIEDSALIFKDYIDGILLHYQASELLKAKKEEVQRLELTEDISHLLLSKKDILPFPDWI